MVLDLSLAPRVLAPAQLTKLTQFLEERASKNKMYCPNKPCSLFTNLDELDSETPNSVLHCPSCEWRLCANCKTAEHPAPTCDENSATLQGESLGSFAYTQGWKRCGKCQVFVALAHGCNHMICVCGHHFCYMRGDTWKQCDCDLWNEENLLLEGNRRVANEERVAGRGLNALEQQQVAQRLDVDNRNFFECEHDHCYERDFNRTKTKGGWERECSNCEHHMPLYAFECSDCAERFCKVCYNQQRHRR
jgi:hypothetical protein